MASTRRKDILVVNANPAGQIEVIGDVHGSKDELEELLKNSGPNDTLCITGDLVDKGKNSLGVIDLLCEEKYKNKVFVIRGNHESLCLSAIDSLIRLAIFAIDNSPDPTAFLNLFAQMLVLIESEPDEEKATALLYKQAYDGHDEKHMNMKKAIGRLQWHWLNNYGGWLVEQFLFELKNDTINITLNKENEGHQVRFRLLSRIGKLQRYIQNLPRLILVKGGPHPFIFGHADFPFGDKELFSVIAAGGYLTREQAYYIEWARPGQTGDASVPIVATGRNSESILGFVGHNILSELAAPIRPETNTINLDACAYGTGIFIIANMTKGEARLSKPTTDPLFLKNRTLITRYLKKQFTKGVHPEVERAIKILEAPEVKSAPVVFTSDSMDRKSDGTTSSSAADKREQKTTMPQASVVVSGLRIDEKKSTGILFPALSASTSSSSSKAVRTMPQDPSTTSFPPIKVKKK